MYFKLLKSACPLEGLLLFDYCMEQCMYLKLKTQKDALISEVRSIVEHSRRTLLKCFDLHGNVTDEIINNINIFTAYRTAPHIDIESTYHRAAKLLTDALMVIFDLKLYGHQSCFSIW